MIKIKTKMPAFTTAIQSLFKVLIRIIEHGIFLKDIQIEKKEVKIFCR